MFVDLPTVSTEASDAAVEDMVRRCGRARAELEAIEAGWVAELDRRGLAARAGCRDTAHWVARHGLASPASAKGRVETARTLQSVPGLEEALASGAIGADHVRCLARAAEVIGADTVAASAHKLIDSARSTPVEHYARRVRRFVVGHLEDHGSEPADALHRQRSATITPDRVTGGTRLHAELHGDDAAVLRNALDALVEQQWRAEHGQDAPLPDRLQLTTRQRLADALVEMARRALGTTRTVGGGPRPTVVVVIDHQTLVGQLAHNGICTLADGTRLPAATARRLACEADLLPVVLDGASQPLDVGRSRRLATAAQRQAMLARSRTCEFPGCDVQAAWCQAHHLTAWDDHGLTDIANLAWLCTRHHHHAHEGGWYVTRDTGGTVQAQPPPPTTHPDADGHQQRPPDRTTPQTDPHGRSQRPPETTPDGRSRRPRQRTTQAA